MLPRHPEEPPERSAEACQVLGHALSDSRQPEAAVTAYRDALRLDPTLADIRNNLGTALRQAVPAGGSGTGTAPCATRGCVPGQPVQRPEGARRLRGRRSHAAPSAESSLRTILSCTTTGRC